MIHTSLSLSIYIYIYVYIHIISQLGRGYWTIDEMAGVKVCILTLTRRFVYYVVIVNWFSARKVVVCFMLFVFVLCCYY